MCGRIFLVVLLSIGAFVAVTVAAFVYLQWWQAILASVALLAVLFLGGKFLLRTAIKAWGEQLTKLTAGQAVVLRNATLQVHKVQRTEPPRELTEEDEFEDDDPDALAERNEEVLGKTWYKIEMTVFPNPDIEESVNPWAPESLVFVPWDSEPPGNVMTGFMEDDVLHPDKMKRVADGANEEAEPTGPQRVLFLVGAPNDLRDLAVRYFTEQFGRIKLPGPLDEAKADPRTMTVHFLGLETSCDETSAAIFTDDLRILSNVVASQNDLHARFGGVVPEIASRAHLRNLLPVIDEALTKARVSLAEIGGIAVHNTPGLVGALLIGVSAAKALSLALNVPLIAVNHVHGHIFACRMAAGRDIFPCVGLVVSGGHTSLFRCETAIDLSLLGGTRDDAAGEAFDKVAAILGLGFPGGPAVEREAANGDPKAFAFPRAFAHDDRLEFSFSGLKTAVLYACHGQNLASGEPPTGRKRADLAASFQAAVVDVLAIKCKQALWQSGLKRLAVGGGVTANQVLRASLQTMCDKEGTELFIPPMSLYTDNAAMAALAVEKWKLGEYAPADLDAEPNFQ